jgi:hypothetical protein
MRSSKQTALLRLTDHAEAGSSNVSASAIAAATSTTVGKPAPRRHVEMSVSGRRCSNRARVSTIFETREASTQFPWRYCTDSGNEARMYAQEGKMLAGPIVNSCLAHDVDEVSAKW